MYFDLNLNGELYLDYKRKGDPTILLLIVSCIEDGYQAVAFNFEVKSGFLTAKELCPFKPIELFEIKKAFESRPNLTSLNNRLETFKQYSRVTIEINDSKNLSQLNDNNTNKFLQSYDLVAVRTNNEKVFQNLLEYSYFDIYSVEISEKLPFYFKRNQVTELLKKGICFEVNYAAALEDSKQRRTVLSNAINIFSLTKGKGVIISSGSKSQMTHRAPSDLIALGTILELKRDQAYEAISETASKILKRMNFRKSFKGMISLAEETDKRTFIEKEKSFKSQKKDKALKNKIDNTLQALKNIKDDKENIERKEESDPPSKEKIEIEDDPVNIKQVQEKRDKIEVEGGSEEKTSNNEHILKFIIDKGDG